MLDLVELMVKELGMNYLRMDGNTKINLRAGIVNKFNNDKNIFIILLTTKTGGVGISLTAANRVGKTKYYYYYVVVVVDT